MTDTLLHPHQDFDDLHLDDQRLPDAGAETPPDAAAATDLKSEDYLQESDADAAPRPASGPLGRLSLRLGVGVSNAMAGIGEKAGALAKRSARRDAPEEGDAPRRRKLPAGVGAGLAFGAAGVAAYVAAKHGVDMLPKSAGSHDVAQQALGHAPKGGHSELHAQLASYDSPLTPSKVPAAAEHLDFSKPIRPGEGPVHYLTRIGASPKEAHSLAGNKDLMNSLIKSGDAYKAGKFNGQQVWGLNHVGKIHTGKDPAKNGQDILEKAHEHWQTQHGGKGQAIPQPGQGSGGKQQPELPRRGTPSDTATPQPSKTTASSTPTPTPSPSKSAAAGAPAPTQSTPHPSTTSTHSHSPTPSPSVTAPLGDSAKQASHGHTPIGDRIAYGLTGGFAGGVITGVSDIVGNTIKEKNIPELETMTPEQKRALLVSTIGGMLLGGFAGGTASGELYLMTEAATGLIAGSAGYVLGKKPLRRQTHVIPLSSSTTPGNAPSSGEGSRAPRPRLRRLRVPRGEPGAGKTQQVMVASSNGGSKRLDTAPAVTLLNLPPAFADNDRLEYLEDRFKGPDISGMDGFKDELAQVAERARIADRDTRTDGELASFYESVRELLQKIGPASNPENALIYKGLGVFDQLKDTSLPGDISAFPSRTLRTVAEALFGMIPPEMQDEDNLDDVAWLIDSHSSLTPGEQQQSVRLSDALELITNTQFGSPSMLENKLRISFTEAEELMNMLEVLEVVGPSNGGKARDVKIAPGENLYDIINRLRPAGSW